MAIEYKTVTYRTVESTNDNATYCWVELSASHVPSVNGLIKRIVVQGATTSASGMTTDPMYLGLWERQDDGGLISLGCSKNAVTQALNQENTWDFDGAIVSGKSLLLGLLSSPDEHWTNNTDLLLRSRVQTNDTDGCVILTNIGRLRVTPDITFTVEYPEYVPDADPEPEPEPESEQRVIDISKYWIPIIRKTANFQQIAAAENPEFNLLVEKLNALEKDGFIPTATEYGVKRWEQILGLVASDGMTLDERKAQILNYLNVKTAYTIRTLRQMLAAIVGEGNYTMHIDNDTQTLHIEVPFSMQSKVAEVEQLLKRVLPMNLDVDILVDGFPTKYTQLEYIESTGTQYIDTGIVPTSLGDALGMSVKVYITQKQSYVSLDCGIVGSRNGINNKNECQLTSYRYGLFRWGAREYVLGSRYLQGATAVFNVKNLTYSSEVGSSVSKGTMPEGEVLSDYPMTLFALNISGSVSQFGILRVFYLTLFDGDEPILDFVPVLDASGTPCMFDKVSRKCFYNNGTGTFGYKIKTAESDIMTLELDDPNIVAPSGIYARLAGENELEIFADTEIDSETAKVCGYTWFANTGEAYEHFNIKEVIENE